MIAMNSQNLLFDTHKTTSRRPITKKQSGDTLLYLRHALRGLSRILRETKSMRTVFFIFFLILLTNVLWAPVSLAAPLTSKAPVHIRADQFSLDQAKGIGTYSGNVQVTQGKLRIDGTKLIILLAKKGGIERLTMNGAPARFRDVGKNGKLIIGQAMEMIYIPSDQRIVLKGKARVEQNGNTFQATRIVYDVQKGSIEAGAPGQRIEATFTPAHTTTRSKQ